MMKMYHKLMVKLLKWYRERQTDDIYIDVLDSRIWYHENKGNTK